MKRIRGFRGNIDSYGWYYEALTALCPAGLTTPRAAMKKIMNKFLSNPLAFDGWVGGLPPGVTEASWPRASVPRLRLDPSPKLGREGLKKVADFDFLRMPMRHIFTVKVPEEFRAEGAQYVGLSMFCADFMGYEEHIKNCRFQVPISDERKGSIVTDLTLTKQEQQSAALLAFLEYLMLAQKNSIPRTADDTAGCYELAFIWHTEESFRSARCPVPLCCDNTDVDHCSFLSHGGYIYEEFNLGQIEDKIGKSIPPELGLPIELVAKNEFDRSKNKLRMAFSFGGWPQPSQSYSDLFDFSMSEENLRDDIEFLAINDLLTNGVIDEEKFQIFYDSISGSELTEADVDSVRDEATPMPWEEAPIIIFEGEALGLWHYNIVNLTDYSHYYDS
jgi:hypothetical protein